MSNRSETVKHTSGKGRKKEKKIRKKLSDVELKESTLSAIILKIREGYHNSSLTYRQKDSKTRTLAE